MSMASPSELPPSVSATTGGAGADADRPQDLSTELAAAGLAGGQGEAAGAAPTLAPTELAAGAGGITAWVNNQRIAALWSINQNRNSWAYVANVGWKKLANNSDTAIVALTILAGNAKQTQTAVNYREEADGMIHELYVF